MLRRYSDFIWLREQLLLEFPSHLIPTMPPKHNLQGNKMDPKFLEVRRRGLERFLKRVVKQPVLSYSVMLKIFLESKPHVFATAKKERETSLVDGATNAAVVLTMKLMTKIPPDPKFEAVAAEADETEKTMRAIQEAGSASSEAVQLQATEARTLATAVRKFAHSEAELSPLLAELEGVLDNQAAALAAVVDATEEHIVETAQQYTLSCDAIRKVLDRRDTVSIFVLPYAFHPCLFPGTNSCRAPTRGQLTLMLAGAHGCLRCRSSATCT